LRRRVPQDVKVQGRGHEMKRLEEHRSNRASPTAALVFITTMLIAPLIATAQPQQTAPNNTKTNQGDVSAGAVTAGQQKMNPADRDTTKQIRAAIMKDKSLSTYAHNVKVITQNGQVTLKGPVRSDDEKNSIGMKATAVAGAGNVSNDLTVA
jgi:hyperosmotically inducible periplasmic protein